MEPATANDETTRRILVPTRRGRHGVLVRQYQNPASPVVDAAAADQRRRDDDVDDEQKVTPEERQLLDVLAVSVEDFFQESDASDLRPEALHLVGLASMSTEDVFDLLQLHQHQQSHPPWPEWLEWVNDNACNAVYRGPRQALAALARLCYHPLHHSQHHHLHQHHLLRVSGGSRCLRSRDGRVLARFATANGDVKARGANRSSSYYRRHGNPNYGNLAGFISQSYRRRVNAERDGLEMLALASSSAALAASERRRRKLVAVAIDDERRENVGEWPAKRLRQRSPSPPLSGCGDLRNLLRQAAASTVSPSVAATFIPSPSPSPSPARYRVRRQFLARRRESSSPDDRRHRRCQKLETAAAAEAGAGSVRRLASVIVRPPQQQQQQQVMKVTLPKNNSRSRSRSRSGVVCHQRRSPVEVLEEEEGEEMEVNPEKKVSAKSTGGTVKWEPAVC